MHISDSIKKLYHTPLSASRTGALYNAFSYPTKISPEAIALFIACHTEPGAAILDPFSGSGTTGLAAKLCDVPTSTMLSTAAALGLDPKWGPRNALLYELSSSGALAASTMCNPPEVKDFETAACELLAEVRKELGSLYEITDNEGKIGSIRYVVWSEVLVCPSCRKNTSFWESCVTEQPPAISDTFTCPQCMQQKTASLTERAIEEIYDPVLKRITIQKKRVPVKVYGRTGKTTWRRLVNDKDILLLTQLTGYNYEGPVHEINWGVLYRKGYHQGISHLHHFYTRRNALVFSILWNRIKKYPTEVQDSLRLLLLSYNSSHSTLMTRIVSKSNESDFVITGAQSGVLYISSLPVEKNIFEGIERKIKTFSKAFGLVTTSRSCVTVVNQSSTNLTIDDKTIDYVFTDPPFGDYIPYSEINQINEAWLEKLTETRNEVIVNTAQNKSIINYEELMGQVLSEVGRVMKDNGALTLVFHSAKANIWQTLINAYRKAGLQVITSTILDKLQSSFKQTNSKVSVKGDPILLLIKDTEDLKSDSKEISLYDDRQLIAKLISKASLLPTTSQELSRERLYSRYINACLTHGKEVSCNAADFYLIVEELLKEHSIS